MTFEIYYGYYLGDCQMWDTEYVDSASSEKDALEQFDARIHSMSIDIAFRGIFCVQDEERIGEVKDDSSDRNND